MPNTTWIWCALTAPLALTLALGACSHRKTDPDFSEYIAEVCVSACSTADECGTNQLHADLEECTDACIGSDRWTQLDQCDSSQLQLDACLGSLSCAQLDAYNAWVMEGAELDADFPCWDALSASADCDASEPFESPEQHDE